MEIGICTSLRDAALLPPDALDFVEVNVQNFLVPDASDAEFAPHLEAAKKSPKPVRAANCFLPAEMKCVGPEVDTARLLRWGASAFSRAQQVGIEIIVFGSGAARKVPEGFSKEEAFGQFVAILRQLAPLAEKHGVTVVIEPLNTGECNLINSLADGARAVEQAGHPSIRLLADTYHMAKESEPPSEIARHGGVIAHVHVAELEGRAWPGKSREDGTPYYRALREAGYKGRMSLECKFDEMPNEAGKSMIFLRDQLAAAVRSAAGQ